MRKKISDEVNRKIVLMDIVWVDRNLLLYNLKGKAYDIDFENGAIVLRLKIQSLNKHFNISSRLI